MRADPIEVKPWRPADAAREAEVQYADTTQALPRGERERRFCPVDCPCRELA